MIFDILYLIKLLQDNNWLILQRLTYIKLSKKFWASSLSGRDNEFNTQIMRKKNLDRSIIFNRVGLVTTDRSSSKSSDRPRHKKPHRFVWTRHGLFFWSKSKSSLVIEIYFSNLRAVNYSWCSDSDFIRSPWKPFGGLI